MEDKKTHKGEAEHQLGPCRHQEFPGRNLIAFEYINFDAHG